MDYSRRLDCRILSTICFSSAWWLRRTLLLRRGTVFFCPLTSLLSFVRRYLRRFAFTSFLCIVSLEDHHVIDLCFSPFPFFPTCLSEDRHAWSIISWSSSTAASIFVIITTLCHSISSSVSTSSAALPVSRVSMLVVIFTLFSSSVFALSSSFVVSRATCSNACIILSWNVPIFVFYPWIIDFLYMRFRFPNSKLYNIMILTAFLIIYIPVLEYFNCRVISDCQVYVARPATSFEGCVVALFISFHFHYTSL